VTGREAVAGLGGTGRLADDLYLMAHHDVSGRPYLQPRATGLGLAAALLAELVLARRIGIGPQGVVAASRKPPQDELAARVLDQVARERERRPAGEWLAFLGTTAAADVAGRLEEAGYLTRVASRRPRHGPRWVPADSDCTLDQRRCMGRRQRLASDQLDHADAELGSLVDDRRPRGERHRSVPGLRRAARQAVPTPYWQRAVSSSSRNRTPVCAAIPRSPVIVIQCAFPSTRRYPAACAPRR
jgi:hypothetical protein